MGLRDRWQMLVAAASAEPAATGRTVRREEFSWLGSPWSAGGIYGGVGAAAIAPRVSRDEALQVPAVMRGRNLICGSLASLPLRCIDDRRRPVALSLLEQIDPFVPNVVTLAQTFEDLLFEGLSWWRIVGFEPRGASMWPSRARHVDVTAVSMSPPDGYPLHTLPSGAFPNGVVWVMGEPVPAESMVRFDSPNPPLLTHGARAIRRALKLEQAAEMYADDPSMRGYFTPGDGADPADDDEIEDILTQWQAARQRRTTGYVPLSLKYNPLEVMSPAELQLAELQSKANLALANLMGIDPEDLGVSTTSRTYQNAVDRRQDRINETYAAYLRAIADRLSMGDVTPSGQRIVWDLDDFLKADPKTRWETYRIARDLEAIEVDEIRAEEDLPELPPRPQRPAIEQRPKPAAVPAGQQTNGAAMEHHLGAVRFSAPEMTGQRFTFEAAEGIEFKADPAKRTVSGMLLPFGPVGRNGQGRWRFAPGSVEWNRSAVSRVKLNREHDRAQLLGAATAVQETDGGVAASFKVGRTSSGDQALSEAEDEILDGLSAEVDILDYTVDPVDDGVFLVAKARLTGAALTATPAFDDARLTSVAASAHPTEGNNAMPCSICGKVHAPGTPCAAPTSTTLSAPAAAPAAAPVVTPAPVIDSVAFTAAVEAFTAAVERLGTVPQEQRQVVPAGQAAVREPLAYSLDGNGASFVRDAWVARTEYGAAADEALSRLRKYAAQTAELSSQATARFANAGNITDQAQIIPPGYRPDLYVGQIPQGRPLFEAMSRGAIANATPFKVPVWVGSSGLSGTNSENTGPSTGTITDHTYRTVTPTAQSGEFVISRELVDSSNPAIDQIALAAMREEYSQDTEAVIATALAGATDNDTGSGQSTEGCYVYTNVGDGTDLSQKLRVVEGEFPFHRYTVAPDRILLSSRGFGSFTSAFDSSGRPLFPYLAPSNAPGTVGQSAQSLNIDGLAGTPAWALTAGTDDVVVFNHVDAWAWESPLLTFRFEEKAGPESIVLNLWGYFAFQILRYTGIHSIAHTPA
jgi:hypothetical protein